MLKMYCRRCGKDMGQHKYHSKGMCKQCKRELWREMRRRSYAIKHGENSGKRR
ncbi:MAG: hypothetical protein ACE5QW_09665 [Thermoplasmata archaeon]